MRVAASGPVIVEASHAHICLEARVTAVIRHSEIGIACAEIDFAVALDAIGIEVELARSQVDLALEGCGGGQLEHHDGVHLVRKLQADGGVVACYVERLHISAHLQIGIEAVSHAQRQPIAVSALYM